VNRDDIIRMAREATVDPLCGGDHRDLIALNLDELERFAALVAAHEREACEKLVWNTPELDDEYVSHREAIAAAIRARGEA